MNFTTNKILGVICKTIAVDILIVEIIRIMLAGEDC